MSAGSLGVIGAQDDVLRLLNASVTRLSCLELLSLGRWLCLKGAREARLPFAWDLGSCTIFLARGTHMFELQKEDLQKLRQRLVALRGHL